MNIIDRRRLYLADVRQLVNMYLELVFEYTKIDLELMELVLCDRITRREFRLHAKAFNDTYKMLQEILLEKRQGPAYGADFIKRNIEKLQNDLHYAKSYLDFKSQQRPGPTSFIKALRESGLLA